jgi:hypothetical protein
MNNLLNLKQASDALAYGAEQGRKMREMQPSIFERALTGMKNAYGAVDQFVGTGLNNVGNFLANPNEWARQVELERQRDNTILPTDEQMAHMRFAMTNPTSVMAQGAYEPMIEKAQNIVGTGTMQNVGKVPLSQLTSRGLQTDPPGIQASGVVSKYDVPAGSRQEYLGAAPDRSDVSYVRYMPAKGTSHRLQIALSNLDAPGNPIKAKMIAQVRKGQQMGGDDWYNTEELRNWFIDALGAERGDAEWRQFMYLMGASSPGAKVPQNIRIASYMRKRMSEDPDYIFDLLEADSKEAGIALSKLREEGFGHQQGGLQEKVLGSQMRGEWAGDPDIVGTGFPQSQGSWVKNPKAKGYVHSLMGGQRNSALDIHFTRYFGMASDSPEWLKTTGDVSQEFKDFIWAKYPKARKYFGKRKWKNKQGQPEEAITFKPKKAVESGDVPFEDIKEYPSVWDDAPRDVEYGAMEQWVADTAREMGMTPAQFQANLWLGAADETGVDRMSRGTFMEIFRRRAAATAKERGTTVEKVIDDFIRKNGTLALLGAVGIPAAMSQMQQEEDLSL